MSGPPIYVVLAGHYDFTSFDAVAWFFDEGEAKAHADKVKADRGEWHWVRVEETPCGNPMKEKDRW